MTDVKKVLGEKKFWVGDDSNNDTARSCLNATLTKDQLRQLRIAVVKQRFAKPSDLFDPMFLDELGFQGEAALEFYRKMAMKEYEVDTRIDKLRIGAVNDALPPNAQDVVWRIFGKELCFDENGGQWDKIAILPEVGVLAQLNFAVAIQLPQKMELSKEQRSQLRTLDEERSRRRRLDIYYAEGEISSQLSSILSGPQRFAVVQFILQRMMREDLLVVLRPEIAQHFDLNSTLVSEAKVELTESKKRIEELEKLQLVLACSEVLKTLPPPARTVITDLVEGVWAFD